uniref:Transcriptional regulator n=2 Tax=Caenorhabditis tropicalis TaxID=1561998 RepID=A0A1I7U637_9PELO
MKAYLQKMDRIVDGQLDEILDSRTLRLSRYTKRFLIDYDRLEDEEIIRRVNIFRQELLIVIPPEYEYEFILKQPFLNLCKRIRAFFSNKKVDPK